MSKFVIAFILFGISIGLLILSYSTKFTSFSKSKSVLTIIPTMSPKDTQELNNIQPSDDSDELLIISPNKKYKAFRNDSVKSLQIIEILTNNIVFEIKDYINPNVAHDDPNSGNTLYLPIGWSPDSQSLAYKKFGCEWYSIGLISMINGTFTNKMNNLSQGPQFSNCGNIVWSPDSKKLVEINENRNPCVSIIYNINPDKGILTKYINYGNFKSESEQYDSIEGAVWSDDSQSIVLKKERIYDTNIRTPHPILKEDIKINISDFFSK